MPMTRRQLHQTEIDYQDFLPRHAHVVNVMEAHHEATTKSCAICREAGNTKKIIYLVAPVTRVDGIWRISQRVVCRIGKACRGRAYDKQATHTKTRRRTP